MRVSFDSPKVVVRVDVGDRVVELSLDQAHKLATKLLDAVNGAVIAGLMHGDRVARDPCSLCGKRHVLDEFKIGRAVRTRVERDTGFLILAGMVGIVREWSQYGCELFYRVEFSTGAAANYAPCELRSADCGCDAEDWR